MPTSHSGPERSCVRGVQEHAGLRGRVCPLAPCHGRVPEPHAWLLLPSRLKQRWPPWRWRTRSGTALPRALMARRRRGLSRACPAPGAPRAHQLQPPFPQVRPPGGNFANCTSTEASHLGVGCSQGQGPRSLHPSQEAGLGRPPGLWCSVPEFPYVNRVQLPWRHR